MRNTFHNIINSALTKIPKNQSIAAIFSSNRKDIKRYVIGKNEQSVFLIQNFNIDGVIDDFEKDKLIWNKVPIVKTNEISKDAIVVNCVTSISPVTVNKNLVSAGIRNILSYWELTFDAQKKIPLPNFVEDMRTNFKMFKSEWLKIYQILTDQESKKTLLDIILYRLTADTSYMKKYKVRLNQQYFEEFMDYKKEVFVDMGGFDGDTTEEFCHRYQDWEKILFFEPSTENITVAKKRLKKFKNIEFFQFGLSDREGQLSFNTGDGSASAIAQNGNTTINVTTLDEKIKKPVSFIKMDIEGWELKALNGCKNHIKNNKPKLAIAVYHFAKDFFQIPNFILSISPEYDLYLRHYTEGWSETVMYFVPK